MGYKFPNYLVNFKIEMGEDKIIHIQLKHCFNLHSEYIHYDEIFEDDDDNELYENVEDEDGYDTFKQWVEDEKNGLNEIEEMLESEVYPQLADIDILKPIIEKLYPNLVWKLFTDNPINGKVIMCHIGSVYTLNGLLEFIICSEDNMVYKPIRMEVSLTDYPYKEVREISKLNKWYLFHMNSMEYLDNMDDGEIGVDIISPSC